MLIKLHIFYHNDYLHKFDIHLHICKILFVQHILLFLKNSFSFLVFERVHAFVYLRCNYMKSKSIHIHMEVKYFNYNVLIVKLAF